jgi:hypothetical protein
MIDPFKHQTRELLLLTLVRVAVYGYCAYVFQRNLSGALARIAYDLDSILGGLR